MSSSTLRAALPRPEILSLGLLAALAVAGLVVAALPPAPPTPASVRLEGVQLQLYPAQSGAVSSSAVSSSAVPSGQAEQWRFTAQKLTIDPEQRTSTLSGLGVGERWVTEPGHPPRLDMTLRAPGLVIDAQDNLQTPQATLYMPSDCSTFTLSGTAQQPVVISPLGGYTAPRGRIVSPFQTGAFRDITANFDFSSFQAQQEAGMELHTAPQRPCVAPKTS